MFTENHVDTISARYIALVLPIVQATRPEEIPQLSWGSAVLAATYRGMCNACTLSRRKSALLGCPLLLQLWSWERFPIARPDIYIDEEPFSLTEMLDAERIDMPTIGTLWTRRKVCILFLFAAFSTYLTILKLIVCLRRDGSRLIK